MWPTFDQQHPHRTRSARATSPAPSRAASRPGLTLSTDSRPDGLVVVRVTGEVDHCTAPVLSAHLGDLLQDRFTTVVVDLSGVEFLGVAGLGALLAIRAEAHVVGAELRVAACSPPVRRALEVTGLAETFPSHPDRLDPLTTEVQQRTPRFSLREAPMLFGGA